MRTKHGLAGLTALLLASCGQTPDPIVITGSSTVYPFTKAVAEALVEAKADTPTPRVEEVGTVSGVAAFCAGPDAPDVLDASRRLSRAEFDKCKANRVGDILEVPIGLDGVALVESQAGPKIELSAEDLYRALAANPGGKPNTTKTWRDVNAKLPAIPIKVLGPPPSSGTRESFATLILEPGCIAAMPAAAALRNDGDPAKFDAACHAIRGDGAYQPAGENDNAIVSALEADKNAIGLLGFSYLQSNAAGLRGVPVDGVTPDADTIARGAYKGGRLLYLYVKKSRLEANPALRQFLDMYLEMAKPGGALAKRGLIAMSEDARTTAAETVKNATPLAADKLY